MNYAVNEWDKLKKVIVGTATGARIPPIDKSMRTVNYADHDDVRSIKVGPYPQVVIDEANEDLENLCNFLKGEGVEVLRPQQQHPVLYYDYCPRDLVFVHGEHCMATPMSLRCRKYNYQNIENHLPGLQVAQTSNSDSLYNSDCIGDPDTLALHETFPSFDAANIIRANDDLLYLVSNSGNKAGADFLREATGLNVHTLEGVYSYMHIDSTVAFLREGLMLLNPSRIKSKDQLPEPFRSWDAIWATAPTDIGYYGNYNHASVWINMNLFSVNPNLVVLEEHQHELRKQLAYYGIESAMLPIRHQRTLGGGFHCVTLDLERDGV